MVNKSARTNSNSSNQRDVLGKNQKVAAGSLLTLGQISTGGTNVPAALITHTIVMTVPYTAEVILLTCFTSRFATDFSGVCAF
jgi:hypothetical protein